MSISEVPVFLLAGGLGTRLAEETGIKPKPMVEIGDLPILVHIMRWYYAHGFNDFIVCAGYKSWEIKKYFLEYEFRCNHLEMDHRQSANPPPHPMGRNTTQEKWRVRVIDTGAEAMTGARIAKAYDLISQTQPVRTFAVTYGDGVSNADLRAELEFHQRHGKLGTVLGVKPQARFGELDITDHDVVSTFLEKPESRHAFINGGYFFFNRDFRDYLDTAEQCTMERAPLQKLALDGQLRVFKHAGYWHPMDTLSDKRNIESLWQQGNAPWAPSRARVG